MPLLRDDASSSAFDHGSARYDRLTAMNPGYHAHLRRSAGWQTGIAHTVLGRAPQAPPRGEPEQGSPHPPRDEPEHQPRNQHRHQPRDPR
ncbi:hypothetical protein [Streptomyces sp. CBMA29]|uniref:hypothetical protein n=1 Tax=Streptomyces sp. CBMA29 TaxID=1896314 RepID=UPI001661CD28|nr:hypothetical protein [Streptomyces sp. CBMA29]MBD0734286.1 hypothetical protein [Streptomyces sp. CBMA29]